MEEKDLKQIKETVAEAVRGLPTKDDVTEAVRVGTEELAQLVSRGFESVDKGFESVDKGFESVDKRFESIAEQLSDLETGQQEIKLRLDNVAYRFELVELQRRVELLEKKTGIKA